MIDKKTQSTRFQKPDEGEAYQSKFDFHSDELLDLDQRQDPGFSVMTLDLSVQPTDPRTGKTATFYEWLHPGRGVVAYFYDSSDVLKTPIGGLIQMTTQNSKYEKFPLKNGRGIRVDFTRLYLSWANQTSTVGMVTSPVFCDICILNYNATPFSGSI